MVKDCDDDKENICDRAQDCVEEEHREQSALHNYFIPPTQVGQEEFILSLPNQGQTTDKECNHSLQVLSHQLEGKRLINLNFKSIIQS